MTTGVGMPPGQEAAEPRASAGDDRRRRKARTTPTLLRTAGVVVVTLLVLAGGSGVVAAVIAEFLGGGVEPHALRHRYDGDLAAAAAGLTAAASRTDDTVTADRVADLVAQLPVYASLVERARADNRQGLPVGASYLTRASELMQTTLLPVADALQQRQAERLDDAYRRAGSVPVAALLVTTLAAAVLVAVQVGVARRFRRVLNRGMVVATGVLALGVGWWLVAGILSGGYLDQSHVRSRAVSDTLVPAQIAALQARASEGLALVGRNAGGHEQDFDDRWERLARDDGAGGALGASARLVTDPEGRARLGEALAAARAYRTVHDRVVQADAQGRYADAVRLAVSTDPASAATAFDRLDQALVAAVDAERRSFADQTARAQTWRTGLAAVAAIVAVVGAVASAVGLARRLEQFR